MNKTLIYINTRSALKAIKLKEKILDRLTQDEYLEENDLEHNTLEKIFEEVKKMGYIIDNWGSVYDKYFNKYNIGINHFIEFEHFTHTVSKYSDGTQEEEFISKGIMNP